MITDLVISCMDYRLRADVDEWIDSHLGGQADLISVPGAAKAINDVSSRSYLLDSIQMAIDKHGIQTVHILNHCDCGAYGGSSAHADEHAEERFHADECAAAADVIMQHFPALTVRCYVMNTDGVTYTPTPAMISTPQPVSSPSY